MQRPDPVGLASSKSEMSAELTKITRLMGLRALSLCLVSINSIGVAKKVGVENLGFSALIMSALAFVVTVGGLAQTPVLLMEYYKNERDGGPENLIGKTNALRLMIGLPMGAIIVLLLPYFHPAEEVTRLRWVLIPLAAINVLAPYWIFQAKNLQEKYVVFTLLGQLIPSAALMVYRDGYWPLGSDVLANASANTATSVMCWIWLWRNYAGECTPLACFKFSKLKIILKSSLPLWSASLSGYIYLTFEEQLIGSLASVKELGLYKSAKIPADAVNAILSMSSAVLLPKYIEWKTNCNARYAREFNSNVRTHLLLASLICAAAWMFAPQIHGAIFGDSFGSAGRTCALLLSAKCVVLVSNVYAAALLADPSSYWKFAILLSATAAASVVLNVILIPQVGIDGAAYTTIICESINLLGYKSILSQKFRK